MESELKCPVCSKYYRKPLLLCCSHNLCSSCANNLQESADKFLPEKEESDFPELDKLSIVSETDSGVVCNSRPCSFVSTPSINNLSLSSVYHVQGCSYGIKCPTCKKVTFLGEAGFQSLPRNRILDIIISKIDHEDKDECETQKCDLCENESTEATVMCEQCEIFYCDSCREICHPPRGPFVKHKLLNPEEGKAYVKSKRLQKDVKCTEHTEELLSLYCLTCKIPICATCHHDGPHINHDTQAVGAICKTQKVSWWYLHRLKIAGQSLKRLRPSNQDFKKRVIKFNFLSSQPKHMLRVYSKEPSQ